VLHRRRSANGDKHTACLSIQNVAIDNLGSMALDIFERLSSFFREAPVSSRIYILYDWLNNNLKSWALRPLLWRVYTRRSSRRSVARPIGATIASCKHSVTGPDELTFKVIAEISICVYTINLLDAVTLGGAYDGGGTSPLGLQNYMIC